VLYGEDKSQTLVYWGTVGLSARYNWGTGAITSTTAPFLETHSLYQIGVSDEVMVVSLRWVSARNLEASPAHPAAAGGGHGTRAGR